MSEPVTLVGGGPVAPGLLARARALAPRLVAADGGADRLVHMGLMPEAVIGDLDSLGPAARAALPPEAITRVAEQDSTDFEKCLTRVEAPLALGVGFAPGRMDHFLAALNAMLRHPGRRAILIGPEDIALLAPPSLTLDLPVGSPLSLFPMGPVTAQSAGLEWPLEGLRLAPDGQSGTSNRVTGPVRLEVAAPKLVLLLPLAALETLVTRLASAPRWS